MPDLHWGYGFPIGGVAAFDPETGVISPGGVGYDINCGVRLLASDLPADAVAAKRSRGSPTRSTARCRAARARRARTSSSRTRSSTGA